jgi:uncharacterized integral membrane protein
VIFAAANPDMVTVRFAFLEDRSLPLSVLGLVLLAAGFLSGALFVWIYSRKTVFDYWKEQRRVKRLEKELEDIEKRQAQDTQARSVIPHLGAR